jgi:DNA mismatch repair protein MutL
MRDCVLSVMRHQKYVKLRTVFFAYKGFRGEALASIAAIAHVEMKTKQDQEELERKLLAVSLYPKTWRYCRKALHLGQKIFFNIPARRNF